MQETDDRELLKRLGERDPAAMGTISTRFGDELRLFCQRMVYSAALAEDLVQEVFMTCCRVGQDQLPDGSLRGWLYRVARNRCIDELRRMKPEARLSAIQTGESGLGGVALGIDPATTPAGRAVKHDRAQRVQMVIDGLEDDLREVVVMYYFQSLTHAEIGEALELSTSGAKARLQRATRILRERLRTLDDSTA